MIWSELNESQQLIDQTFDVVGRGKQQIMVHAQIQLVTKQK
jgi:hypothetical protein